MANLKVLTGSNSGLTIELRPPSVVIGRDPDCDVVIPAEWVSRRHCQLVGHGNHWVLVDLGSTNGVHVNALPVTEAVLLMPGDVITLGSMQFGFEAEAEAEDGGGGEEAQRIAPETRIFGEPVWKETAPRVEYVGVGAHHVPIVRVPELHFRIAISAKLMSFEEITQSGKRDLKKLARQGMLAADTAFPGRYSGRFRRVQFIMLDSYDLVGRAGYTLRTGLQLPVGEGGSVEGELETQIEYRREYSLAVAKEEVGNMLGDPKAEPHLTHSGCTVAATRDMADAEATSFLLTESGGSGRAGPFDVPYNSLVDGLEHLCWTCAGEHDLLGILQRLSSESAAAYRSWYGTRWREKAVSHDSQLPVGELRYRFDHRCQRIGQPKAIARASVTRWL